MGWLRRREPACKEIKFDHEIAIADITFKWKVLGAGQFYIWWTCPSCNTELGACNDQGDLRKAVLTHLRNCESRDCGEPSCINCASQAVVVT